MRTTIRCMCDDPHSNHEVWIWNRQDVPKGHLVDEQEAAETALAAGPT